MSRIFLLAGNVTVEPYPVYPLGMAMVAAALEGHGHEVRQFDFLAQGRSVQALEEGVRAFRPEVIGVSLRNIDNVDSFSGESGWYLSLARDLVRVLRRGSGAPVVLGGPAFSIMPQQILDYVGADYGVIGEGEKAFPALVEALERGEKPDALQRGSALLAGEEIGSPSLRTELVRFYQGESGMVNLQTKRGCPYGCTYCTYPCLEGEVFRYRPAGAVVDDIARMQVDHGVDTFFFTDSVFNEPGGHHLAIAEELLRRDVRIRWSAFFRPQGIDRNDLALMKNAGLYALELGTDAASDATLEGIGKGFAFAEAAAVSQACADEELPCAHFVMFGVPGETAQTVREGIDNLLRLEKCVVFAFSGIRILSGTALEEEAIRDGVLAPETSLLRPLYYFSPKIGQQEMNDTLTAAFQGRRDRIFPPSEGQERLSVMHRFGYRGLLWDKLITAARNKGRK